MILSTYVYGSCHRVGRRHIYICTYIYVHDLAYTSSFRPVPRVILWIMLCSRWVYVCVSLLFVDPDGFLVRQKKFNLTKKKSSFLPFLFFLTQKGRTAVEETLRAFSLTGGVCVRACVRVCFPGEGRRGRGGGGGEGLAPSSHQAPCMLSCPVLLTPVCPSWGGISDTMSFS